MYLLMTARKGISSLQLGKEIGVSQKSAWFMLQRLREMRERGGRTRAGLTREQRMKNVPVELDSEPVVFISSESAGSLHLSIRFARYLRTR